MTLSAAQVHHFRLQRSGLLEPAGFSAVDIASHLVGVQAQVLPAAGLAMAQRSDLGTMRDLATMLDGSRDLVKLWGQRGTLHLYPSEEWPMLHASLFADETLFEKRARKSGISAQAYRATLEAVVDLLREQGTLSRDELRASEVAIDEAMISSWGGIFADLVRRGIAVHAGRDGSSGRFAHREHWLPELAWSPPSKQAADLEISRRYLRAYGPATVRDLAYWRGGRIRDSVADIEALGDEVETVRDDQGRELLILAQDRDELEACEGVEPRLMLLYRFDPVVLAHKDKTWIVDEAHYSKVWRPAAIVEPIVLRRGRGAGTWRYDKRSRAIDIEISPWSTMSKADKRAIEARAEDVAAFFELELGRLSYA